MAASSDTLKRECNRHRSVYDKSNINCENEMASLAPMRGFHLLHSKGRQRETCGPGKEEIR